jgi:hypothetical protein
MPRGSRKSLGIRLDELNTRDTSVDEVGVRHDGGLADSAPKMNSNTAVATSSGNPSASARRAEREKRTS